MRQLLLPAFSEYNIQLDEVFRNTIHTALSILLQDHVSCAYVFESIVCFVFQYVVLEHAFEESSVNSLEYILQVVLLEHPSWSKLAHSSIVETLYEMKSTKYVGSFLEASEYKELVTTVIHPIMRPMLQLFQAVHRTRIQEAIKPFKEDLIAQACHPRHIQKLLDQGYSLDAIFDGMGWD